MWGVKMSVSDVVPSEKMGNRGRADFTDVAGHGGVRAVRGLDAGGRPDGGEDGGHRSNGGVVPNGRPDGGEDGGHRENGGVVAKGRPDFAGVLKEAIAKVTDGAVTVSKQDGRALYLTLTRTQGRPFGEFRSVNRHLVPETELACLLHMIDGVRYGTVVLRMQDGRIVGLEKNEKIKL
ncbi:MAG: YezD family protein [Lachnospiraceae bacterium]|jgi:hypothetical protein|nr:YezD family protein [Lachnospiraceae bacterium]